MIRKKIGGIIKEYEEEEEINNGSQKEGEENIDVEEEKGNREET